MTMPVLLPVCPNIRHQKTLTNNISSAGMETGSKPLVSPYFCCCNQSIKILCFIICKVRMISTICDYCKHQMTRLFYVVATISDT